MLNVYLHYSEYDFNKEHPLLVVQYSGGSVGYDILPDGTLRKTCICAARHPNECSCDIVWEEGYDYDDY